jgi:hypothetical protein
MKITGAAQSAFARSATYGGYESVDLASPAEAEHERFNTGDRLREGGSAKAKVVDAMTGSASTEGRRHLSWPRPTWA